MTSMNSRDSGALQARIRAVWRFKVCGMAALCLASAMLMLLLVAVFSQSLPAWQRSEAVLSVPLDSTLSGRRMLRNAIEREWGKLSRDDRLDAMRAFSVVSPQTIETYLESHPEADGTTVEMSLILGDQMDSASKGLTRREGKTVSRIQGEILDHLESQGRLLRVWDVEFFTRPDSSEGELAGVGGALWGTIFAMIITLILSFPTGVMAAIYLEEIARPTRLNRIIEANVNNLAAVPSIIYGLLGLFVFLNLGGLPRSAPLVGGCVLALMTFPYIMIAARASLKAVPPSIREGALGVGASPMQVIVHHVLPLAAPGILTGTIIGMSRAIGETAPLIMIGMMAFIADIPQGLSDPASALPVQIYIWADQAERAYTAKAALAIVALLGVLIAMNGMAVYLRQRLERKW